MPNANIDKNLQRDIEQVSRNLINAIEDAEALIEKYNSLGGSSVFVDATKYRNGVTGAEIKNTVSSLTTMANAFRNSNHDDVLFNLLG